MYGTRVKEGRKSCRDGLDPFIFNSSFMILIYLSLALLFLLIFCILSKWDQWQGKSCCLFSIVPSRLQVLEERGGGGGYRRA